MEPTTNSKLLERVKDAALVVAITPVLGLLGALMLGSWLFTQLEEILWRARR